MGTEDDGNLHDFFAFRLVFPTIVPYNPTQRCKSLVPSSRSEVAFVEAEFMEHLSMRRDESGSLFGIQAGVVQMHRLQVSKSNGLA